MEKMGIILISVILVNNFVLSKFLGICPFLGVSKTFSSSVGMSLAVTFVMVIATAVTYPIYYYVLLENNVEYLQTLVFILIIAALVQLVEIVLKKYIPTLHRSLGIYLPLITTNCAVLGVTLLNISSEFTYLESIVNSLGAGIGFLVAMVIFSGVRDRVDKADVPAVLKGLPITLISAAIVSLAFMAFSGMVKL